MLVHRAELPADLDKLVLKLMAKSPADRYQSAGEMLADLTRLRDVSFRSAQAPTIVGCRSRPAETPFGLEQIAPHRDRIAGSPAAPAAASR